MFARANRYNCNKNCVLSFYHYFNLQPNRVEISVMSSLSGAAPKLTIKAANQKYNDFVIDNFDVDWSVMRLKQYLHLNYPNNPVREINFM